MSATTETRVYRYGLLRPTINADLVRAQMRAGHEYRNTLTQLERERRASVRVAEGEIGASIEPLREQIEAAKVAEKAAADLVKRVRSDSRARSETQEARAALKRARSARAELVRQLREARQVLAHNPEMVRARDEIRARDGERRREARAKTAAYWGTYLLSEDAVQAAAKAPLYADGAPSDPRFARWSGEGRIGVQLQGGMAVHDVFGDDTRMQIDRVPEGAWYSEKRSERRRLSRTVLRLRVGSTETGGPVWAAWPMVMHRELPRDGAIKRAVVALNKIGPREEWSLLVTVTMPSARRLGNGGAVALDIGWRVIEDELRIASWIGEDGEKGEVRIGGRALQSFQKADELRSVRDKNFDVALAAFGSWLTTATDVPAWMTERTATIKQWRSPARLAALCLAWRKERWVGDDDGLDPLDAWRYHDYHLWEWETSQRIKAIRHRRECYRIVAAELATKYGHLVLEEFDLSRIARRPATAAPDDEKAQNDTARANRQRSALSSFRDALKSAFGANVSKVDGAYSTRECSTCGKIDAWDTAARLRHACSACGAKWDQDENACVNLLARWRERPSGDESQDSARNGENVSEHAEVVETRWQRARRLASERAERMATARKVVANSAEGE